MDTKDSAEMDESRLKFTTSKVTEDEGAIEFK